MREYHSCGHLWVVTWISYEKEPCLQRSSRPPTTRGSNTPTCTLSPSTIKDYEIEEGVWSHNWDHRCYVCDLWCDSQEGSQYPQPKKSVYTTPQDFSHTLVDNKVNQTKFKIRQQDRPYVYCGDRKLNNVFTFKYLDSSFSTDRTRSKTSTWRLRFQLFTVTSCDTSSPTTKLVYS